jgi:hypothetical protein
MISSDHVHFFGGLTDGDIYSDLRTCVTCPDIKSAFDKIGARPYIFQTRTTMFCSSIKPDSVIPDQDVNITFLVVDGYRGISSPRMFNNIIHKLHDHAVELKLEWITKFRTVTRSCRAEMNFLILIQIINELGGQLIQSFSFDIFWDEVV